MVQTVPLDPDSVKQFFRGTCFLLAESRYHSHMRPIFAALATFSVLALAQTPAAWEEPLARHEWDKAEPLLKAALAETETAPVLRGLAAVYRATGRMDAADPVLEKLVALDGSVTNLEDLARIKASLGYLDRAETLYRQSLAMRMDGNPDLLASIPIRVRLAQVLVSEKKFPEAEQEGYTVIALRTRAAGANLPGANQADLAGDNALLARIFQVQKKWQAAASAWETVALIQTDAYGDEDLRLADTLDRLSDCRFEMGLVDPAVDPLRRALILRELNLGTMHADVAATTDHLGKILYYAKRYSEAEPYFRRTLDIDLKLPDSDSPELARAYDNLAVTEAMIEKYAQAEAHYREALKLRDADDTLSLRNLALVLTAQNKNAEAQPLYRRALIVLDAGSSADPEFLKVILTEYSSLLRDLKRPVDAAKLEQRLKQAKQIPKQAPIAAKQ
jgi:tetratricopeptide (TPR) repeat protein